jgi:hypothetical protein
VSKKFSFAFKVERAWVNFINPLVKGANVPGQRVWHKRCSSISSTELRSTPPLLRTRSYALLLGCTLYASVFQPFWVHGTLNDFKNLATPLSAQG